MSFNETNNSSANCGRDQLHIPSPQVDGGDLSPVTISPRPPSGELLLPEIAATDAASDAGVAATSSTSGAVASSTAPIKRVCFICGSHTSQTINIYERRAGPNLIDVINAKFKVPPLTEDKFLCYSCNNWLINWYSVQNEGDGSTTPPSTSSHTPSASSSAGGIPKNTRRYISMRGTVVTSSHCSDTASKKAAKKAPKITTTPVANIEFNEDVYYFRGCVDTIELRSKLSQYIHRIKVDEPVPPITAPSTTAADVVTITKIEQDTSLRRPVIAVKDNHKRRAHANRTYSFQHRMQSIRCYMCSKPMHLRAIPPCPWRRRLTIMPNPRCVRLCRQCRRATHRIYFAPNKANEPPATITQTTAVDHNQQQQAQQHKSFVRIVCDPLAELRAAEGESASTAGSRQHQQQQTFVVCAEQRQRVVNPNVVSRLKRLGTTVMREGEDEEDEFKKDDNDEVMVIDEDSDRAFSPSSTTHLRQSSPLLFSSLSKRPRRNPHHDEQPSPVSSRPLYSSSSIASSSIPSPTIDPLEIRSWQQTLERNDKNEIVLAFDRTLTEVFPSASDALRRLTTAATTTQPPMAPFVDLNKAMPLAQGCGFSASTPPLTQSAKGQADQPDGIYSRIPKSLSITMLMANS